MLQKKQSAWQLSQAGLVCLLLTLAGVNALLWAGDVLPGWAVWTAWGVVAAGLLLLSAPLLRPLFGPVLFYDLIRSTRRGRYALLRCLYAAALLLMLFLCYSRWCNGFLDVFSVQGIDRTRAAQFAEEFFYGLLIVQAVAVILLTPACTAGALAEEKDRRTLEFLFTTDLLTHEIVFGKLFSRLAFLTLLLLTGLPVLSLLQFLGGVDPLLVVGGFAGTLLTMLSLASLSLLNSAYARKPITAMFLTYLQVAIYLVGSTILAGMIDLRATTHDVGGWLAVALCSGNVYVVLVELERASYGPGGVTAALPGVLAAYGGFHGVVALLSLLGASVPLRRWVRLQASRGNRRAFVLALTQRRLPLVGRNPLVWKEVHAEPTFRFNRTGMVLTATIVSVSLILGFFFEVCEFALGLMDGELAQHMNMGARVLGTFIACLLLLGVVIRAAGSFSGERDRQTLVSLLSTPVEGHEILGAKWLGSVLVGRKIWLYLGAIWLAALFTGGLHPVALPLLVFAWFCYAAFLASLGLWFSLVSRTSLRATVGTLLVVLGACVGPWLLSAFWMFVVNFVRPTPYARWSGPVPMYGARPAGWDSQLPELLSALAPPATLNFLTFTSREPMGGFAEISPYGPPPVEPWVRLLAVVGALLVYLVAAVVLYNRTCARFPEVTGRMPLSGAGPPRPARRSA